MTRDIPHQGQYADDLHFRSEMEVNMSEKSNKFIGESRKMNHRQIVMPKVIKSTALTERRNEVGPKIDVGKNFSRLPKSHNDPIPNDYGQPVVPRVFKK
ncbi:MAG TPA: hypothetical protein ACFYEC_01510 [Candidatus Brocadiaceae bacterium]